jgi:hypothetical protein
MRGVPLPPMPAANKWRPVLRLFLTFYILDRKMLFNPNKPYILRVNIPARTSIIACFTPSVA